MTSSDDRQQPRIVLGRYRLGRLLGKGGMGEVYEATHTTLPRLVAIKKIRANTQDKSLSERSIREAVLGASVAHPNIAQVIDLQVENDTIYIVQELLQGEDLSKKLAREGVLPPSVVAHLLTPILAGLQVIHEKGIVHRDVKPGNIFIHQAADGTAVPKIIDFGIAKSHQLDPLTAGNIVPGTIGYCAPEQFESPRDVDFRIDIYAIGVVIYYCATGILPFPAEDNALSRINKIAKGQFLPPRSVRPDIPEAFEHIILRAMHQDPAQRFSSAMELAQALKPFESTKLAISQTVYGPSHSCFSVPTTHATPSGSVGPITREKSQAETHTESRRWLWGSVLVVSVGFGSLWTLASIVHPPAPVAVPATVVPLAASPNLPVQAMPLPQEGPVETPAAAPTPQVVQPLNPDAPPVVEPTGPAPASSPPGHPRIISRPRRAPARPASQSTPRPEGSNPSTTPVDGPTPANELRRERGRFGIPTKQ